VTLQNFFSHLSCESTATTAAATTAAATTTMQFPFNGKTSYEDVIMSSSNNQ